MPVQLYSFNTETIKWKSWRLYFFYCEITKESFHVFLDMEIRTTPIVLLLFIIILNVFFGSATSRQQFNSLHDAVTN